jgi:hypothetical protein
MKEEILTLKEVVQTIYIETYDVIAIICEDGSIYVNYVRSQEGFITKEQSRNIIKETGKRKDRENRLRRVDTMFYELEKYAKEHYGL